MWLVETFTATVANNTWSIHISPADAKALGDGSYTVTANVSDAAGIPAPPASQGLLVDLTAPTGGTPDLVAARIRAPRHTDDITDVTSPTFTVALGSTVAVGDTVELLLGGSALAHDVTHTITPADITPAA